MSCCHVRASRTLLIELEYILSKMIVVRASCLLSAQTRTDLGAGAPISVPQVRPYSQTMLKSGLRWRAI
jgi:hypothetical protein